MKVKFRNFLFYFGYFCPVETLIIEGNDGFIIGNGYLERVYDSIPQDCKRIFKFFHWATNLWMTLRV